MKLNSNNTLKPKQVNFSFQKPKDLAVYELAFGVSPHFNSEHNELIFDNGDLQIPMKAFNPDTFQVLKSHLETQLHKTKNLESVEEKVRTILLSSMQYQFPDMDTVASKLNLSTRPLQRQLSEKKTSFSNILKDTRFKIAQDLLKHNDLTISEISYTLGYSDLGNFSRSFKKFSGVSPQEFRNN